MCVCGASNGALEAQGICSAGELDPPSGSLLLWTRGSEPLLSLLVSNGRNRLRSCLPACLDRQQSRSAGARVGDARFPAGGGEEGEKRGKRRRSLVKFQKTYFYTDAGKNLGRGRGGDPANGPDLPLSPHCLRRRWPFILILLPRGEFNSSSRSSA